MSKDIRLVSGRTWLAILSVAGGTFALVTTEFLPVGLLPEIAAEIGVSVGTAGMTVTAPGLVAAIAGPLLMLAAGHIDRRLGLLLMTFLLVFSNALAALSASFAVLMVARLLLGMAVAGFWALAVAAAARLVPDEKVGKAFAVILAGVSIGTVAGVPAGTLIGEIASWRLAFFANGAFALLVLVAQALLLPPLPTSKGVRFSDMLALFKLPSARTGLIATALMVAGHFAAYTFVVPLLTDAAGIGTTLVTPILLGYGIAAFAGNFIAGWAVNSRLTQTLLGVGLLLALATGSLALLYRLPAVAVLCVMIWGVAFGALPVSLQTWMYRASSHSPESGQVVFNSLFQWALAAGSLVGGQVVDLVGVPGAAWLGAGLSAIAAAIVLFSARNNPA